MGEGEEPYRAPSLYLAYFKLEVLLDTHRLAEKKETAVQLEFYKRGTLKSLTYTGLETRTDPGEDTEKIETQF